MTARQTEIEKWRRKNLLLFTYISPHGRDFHPQATGSVRYVGDNLNRIKDLQYEALQIVKENRSIPDDFWDRVVSVPFESREILQNFGHYYRQNREKGEVWRDQKLIGK